MRTFYSSVCPATVRVAARVGLERALPWRAVGRVPAAALVDLVLLTAALASSLWAVARRFAWGFSHEAARQALAAHLAADAALAEGLVDGLHHYLPRHFRRRRWDLAFDLHYVPFYGDPAAPGTVGGPKKQGTHRFFAYATAVVVHRGNRWCLGLVPVTDLRPDVVVTALLDQLAARGVVPRCVVLDRGFFSGHVLLALQARRVPYVVGVPAKPGRFQAAFAAPVGHVTRVAWRTERDRRPVAADLVTVQRQVRGACRTEVYAVAGVPPRRGAGRAQRARHYRRLMARRFGIEASYRQLNQGRARTASTDGRARLLWVGVALLLRQAWLWLQRQAAGPRRNWVRWRPDGRLALAVVRAWLAAAVQDDHPERRALPLGQPLDLAALGPLAA